MARRAVGVLVVAAALFAAGGASALAAAGDRLWITHTNGTANEFDQAQAVAVSPTTGAVYVTGVTNLSTDIVTAGYDGATGARLWTRHFTGPVSGYELGNAIAVSPDGTVVAVTGRTTTTHNHGRFLTMAFDAVTGATLWHGFHNDGIRGADSSGGASVAFSPDGATVFVTGSNRYGSYDWTTIAYDVAAGQQKWLASYDNGDRDYAASLAVAPDGQTVYVTGASDNMAPFSADYATIAFNAADGSPRWTARYDSGGDEGTAQVVVSPDGSRVVVTGTSPSHHSFNYLTIAYDAATGGQEWASTYDHAGKLADGAAGLAMAPDGSAVFVTGSSETANRDDDYSTVAYDAASGAQRWVAGYDGPGHGQDDASAVATGGGGSRVFVTGWSVGGDGSLDYATLAYRTSDGTELWRARLNGSAKSDDYATALAVSPNRTQVYVTGETTSTAGDGDYTTVAYATGAQPPARMR